MGHVGVMRVILEYEAEMIAVGKRFADVQNRALFPAAKFDQADEVDALLDAGALVDLKGDGGSHSSYDRCRSRLHKSSTRPFAARCGRQRWISNDNHTVLYACRRQPVGIMEAMVDLLLSVGGVRNEYRQRRQDARANTSTFRRCAPLFHRRSRARADAAGACSVGQSVAPPMLAGYASCKGGKGEDDAHQWQ